MDENGLITSWNKRFIDIWDIPVSVLQTGNYENALPGGQPESPRRV